MRRRSTFGALQTNQRCRFPLKRLPQSVIQAIYLRSTLQSCELRHGVGSITLGTSRLI
ncbi:hypothetical protein C8J47_0823 [Sphingomonas sp. PP-F2F-G114-C0414]|uniref:hypothetical protein n=1 Tax=Sphingomonas sp. PP-F2F-G114-C0414 TaxID=2135662 RepID=UPI000F290747|nr:hypothetical protein [Sphingomonas sp. PP-F2F-G114-C0414]RMB37236.1 hypothetical protein C8J47_0823 [Sphingomonas sp. PP-F2F-G114-C0414]